MLAEILAVLRAHDTLNEALQLYNSMVENVREMYALAMAALRGESPADAVKGRVYEIDKKVNEQERGIRRMLVNHLSLRSGHDAPACLVLMSVVKDTERLGDYCKNLFEVAQMFGQPLAQGRYMTPLVDISKKVESLLAKIGEAFVKSEREIAIAVCHESHTVASECDMILKQLMKDDIPTHKAVAYSLLSRYFKRLARHLGNIASSVVLGVEQIDFEHQVYSG
jgi:phosphate transport system protein